MRVAALSPSAARGTAAKRTQGKGEGGEGRTHTVFKGVGGWGCETEKEFRGQNTHKRSSHTSRGRRRDAQRSPSRTQGPSSRLLR